jgi:hypothetical protein
VHGLGIAASVAIPDIPASWDKSTASGTTSNSKSAHPSLDQILRVGQLVLVEVHVALREKVVGRKLTGERQSSPGEPWASALGCGRYPAGTNSLRIGARRRLARTRMLPLKDAPGGNSRSGASINLPGSPKFHRGLVRRTGSTAWGPELWGINELARESQVSSGAGSADREHSVGT